MNLTKFAVLFVIISLPFYFISNMSIREIDQRMQLENNYRRIVTNAVDDGSLALRLYAKESYDDSAKKQIKVDAQEVMNAFLSSYEYGCKAIGESDKIRVHQSILAVVIVAYDGYYIYSTNEVIDQVSGAVSYRQVLSEKTPYIYREGAQSVRMTLDHQVSVIRRGIDPIDGALWPEVTGTIEETRVADCLPAGLTITNYDSVRTYTITSAIEEALELATRQHNAYTGLMGMSYQFHLPVYDNDQMGRNLQDVGLIAFVQGQAVGKGHYLEMTSFNQSSVLVGDRYRGYEEVDPSGGPSTFYFCHDHCSHDHKNTKDPSRTNQLVEVFATKEEAASQGFWPCKYIGK